MREKDDEIHSTELRAFARAVGTELRLARESLGWSRALLAGKLPSGIGDRTLLSYEHGTRHLTLVRYLEICGTLGFSAPTLLHHALQRARIDMANLPIRVDVRQLIAHKESGFRSMLIWGHNKLVEDPAGIAELSPSAVSELATLNGCSRTEMTGFLTQFVPDSYTPGSESTSS
jgi:transcriptional regulator with XRE-family HTH domain